MAFFVNEQMVLEEIEKITPILKKYYIPYTINKKKIKAFITAFLLIKLKKGSV